MKLYKIRHIPTGLFWAGDKYYVGMVFSKYPTRGGKTYDSKKRIITYFKESFESQNKRQKGSILRFNIDDFEIVEYTETSAEKITLSTNQKIKVRNE